LQQINKIPLENLRNEGKIDDEEYENFMRYAPRLSLYITAYRASCRLRCRV
jgi:hypothetical protein